MAKGRATIEATKLASLNPCSGVVSDFRAPIISPPKMLAPAKIANNGADSPGVPCNVAYEGIEISNNPQASPKTMPSIARI